MHTSNMPLLWQAISGASERAHMPRVRRIGWFSYERICWLWHVGFAIASGLIIGVMVWKGLK